MIKFFRKIRYDLMEKNTTGKYLKYAIGEIVLVVLGILIALGINNWNNEHIAKKQLKEIYKQIQNDLIIDTIQIGIFVKEYNLKDKRIQNILDRKIKPSFYDTITSQNYIDCKICISETTNYNVFQPIIKGANLLKNSGVISIITKDSLPNKIDEFYTYAIPHVESQYKIVENLVYENIKTNEQYSWFVDWTERKYNNDFINFIFESEAYRKQLARYKIYYKQNYIMALHMYKELAIKILKLIELELEEK